MKVRKLKLTEDAGRTAAVSIVLWSGTIPFKGVRRYVWERLWARRYGSV